MGKNGKMRILWSKIKNDKLFRYQAVTTVLFVLLITALAWQSDDAYHAYIMAKNLVLGNGFVYNVGERASASSCPLFTLIIAFGYFFFRKMFLVSLLICIFFSTAAYVVIMKTFCKTEKQVLGTFLTLAASSCFISYTTSGLENCLLFFLAALFLKYYFATERYRAGELLILAILVALLAMTRMDAVLLVVPMALYAYLARRDRVSFGKAVLLGIAGLSPFFLWELFSLFYYGFLVPNTAFVKLGTDIPKKEYLARGFMYLGISGICDVLLIAVPLFVIIVTILLQKRRELFCSAGVLLYLVYVIYIGGDFMLGRHFTVMFLMSVICFLHLQNETFFGHAKRQVIERAAGVVLALGLLCNLTGSVITNQLLFAYGASPISDERAGYFKYTSLYNNVRAYLSEGRLILRDAWNEQGIEEYREAGYERGILRMVPGISIYYNSDMYLNDQYALGDPFLSKLPAVREDGWRIGHSWREVPPGYADSVFVNENRIEDADLAAYYDKILLITRSELFDGERLRAVMEMNLGRYDHLLDHYRNSLDENCRLIPKDE